MRRKNTHKRGRVASLGVVPIVLAGGIACVIGDVDTTALRTTDVSAAEIVALRFPGPLGRWRGTNRPRRFDIGDECACRGYRKRRAARAAQSAAHDSGKFSASRSTGSAGCGSSCARANRGVELPGSAAPVVNDAALPRPVAARAPSEVKTVAGRRIATSSIGRATCSTMRRSPASRNGCT